MVLGALVGLLLVGCGGYWLVSHVVIKPLQRRRRRERRKHKREAKRQASAENGAATTSTALAGQSQEADGQQESSSESDSSDDSEAELPVALFSDDPLLDDGDRNAAASVPLHSTVACCSKTVIGPPMSDKEKEAFDAAQCCSSVRQADACCAELSAADAGAKPRRNPVVRFDVEASASAPQPPSRVGVGVVEVCAPPPPPRQYPPMQPTYSTANGNGAMADTREMETRLDGRACVTTRALVETPPSNIAAAPHLRSNPCPCPEEFEIPLTV